MPTSPSEPGPAGDPAEDAAWSALRELGSLDLDAVVVQGPRPAGERPALVEVETAQGQERLVTVELRHRGQRVEAHEQAADSLRGPERAAARATVAALRSLLPPGVAELHLDWLDVIEGPTESRPSVVHCAVALRTASGEDVLVGSAVIRDDPAGSAARAVLDAVNRRFSDLAGG